MKTTIKNILLSTVVAATALSFSACSLDEENPGGFTMENMAANSVSSYQTLLNQVFFGMERVLYGGDEFMYYTEGDTDLWTCRGNRNSEYTQWFWFFAGSSANTTYTNTVWNAIYDGIGSCNTAITLAEKTPFSSDTERNKQVAIARYMRAVYYFNAVEQFGGVTLITEPGTPNYSPTRTEPMEIYRQVIIPDLQFALEWLDKGTDATCTTPTKKAALGFLAKAALQTYEYGTTEFLAIAQDAANKLIQDCEAGGGTYGAYMYPDYKDVFNDDNNFENKEALWKHRWYVGSEGHGSSNGNYRTNRNVEKFLCQLSNFGARVDDQATRITWEGCQNGVFMPSHHLLSLFVQSDGSLDPRFHTSFSTEWNANQAFQWDAANCSNFRKDASLAGQSLAIGDKAIKIVMPQDADYAAEVATKATSKYLLVDYADVYDDAKKSVKETFNGVENQLRFFYPSLNKHNSGHWWVVNAGNRRNGNLNATFIMRMAEIYLIAAELDLYLNGGGKAMQYINKVRTRAGAQPLSGNATIRTVLDERGRELCGEYCRFYDLKRTGMFKDASYLQETHPDLAKYFKAEYALRPIPQAFVQAITNGAEYQNPGY